MNNMNEYYWIPLLIISAICLVGVIFLCIGIGLLFREKKCLHTAGDCNGCGCTISSSRSLRLCRERGNKYDVMVSGV